MTVDIECCGTPMSLIPARPQDAPFEYLMYCYECGHYEPWDVDEDPAIGCEATPQEDRS
ncbi:hypothetical protein [Nocardia seriolae]|uniref:Uncharacterized protein n=1 Tax=Nocardia seriolae TaxID=37332 RepID=A0A0B8NMD9_9NOCA|nr:hypothetical protein [Nocardia seriolae]APA97086.1 hypothetical protein NS506_03029 [Nocardia seriolae]MTJ65115.1 hypothetical protein [Nocardia seriolae]MTJ76519.1 hypothetical protein [Nocardia seriolae]MTJ86961.1 hypothetical protein [Nocardia seriolae]MTK30956.1 hypothetical protein [Nocardia seriolae]